MDFYVYIWDREDGTPYYIGKGCGTRAFRPGSPPRNQIEVIDNLTEEMAFRLEKSLIKFFGRQDKHSLGVLTNRTDGGLGAINPTEEVRLKISLANKKPKPEEHKRRIGQSVSGDRNGQYGKPSWNRGRKWSLETRRKISEATRGRVPWNKRVQ